MQTNTSREELPDGKPMAQAASEPTVFPRHAVQLSLHEARDLLDKDHYGLDKVASWSRIASHLTCVLVVYHRRAMSSAALLHDYMLA